jgi:hypothetical protein
MTISEDQLGLSAEAWSEYSVRAHAHIINSWWKVDWHPQRLGGYVEGQPTAFTTLLVIFLLAVAVLAQVRKKDDLQQDLNALSHPSTAEWECWQTGSLTFLIGSSDPR